MLLAEFRTAGDDDGRQRAFDRLKSQTLKSDARPEVEREVSAAIALIRRSGTTTRFLTQYDSQARRFQLIGGKCEEADRTADRTAVRETREELELPPETAVEVTSLDASLSFEDLSPTTAQWTSYRLQLFFVVCIDTVRPENSKQLRWLEFDRITMGAADEEMTRLGLYQVVERLPDTRFLR